MVCQHKFLPSENLTLIMRVSNNIQFHGVHRFSEEKKNVENNLYLELERAKYNNINSM